MIIYVIVVYIFKNTYIHIRNPKQSLLGNCIYILIFIYVCFSQKDFFTYLIRTVSAKTFPNINPRWLPTRGTQGRSCDRLRTWRCTLPLGPKPWRYMCAQIS